MIYLDSSATSPLSKEAKLAMLSLMNLSEQRKLGNPSSLHTSGITAKNYLEESRKTISKLINSSPKEIIFTSGGTESNNTIIKTFENCPILVSKIEHPSVLAPAEEYGNPCIKIPVDQKGLIDLNFLSEKLNNLSKTHQKILVSVMLANNETGIIEPIEKISKILKEINKDKKIVYLQTDATQAVGKINVNVKKLGVDYLTFTSHKIGGPVGISANFIKFASPYKVLLLGGAQENKKRAGTSNVILAEGFRASAEKILKENTPALYETRIRPLKDYLAQKIQENIKSAKIITSKPCLPNILNVSFPGAEGESTQLYLDLNGFEISTGSACASGDLEPSHVLMAMFGDPEIAHNSVRFSLDLSTTKTEINELIENLTTIIKKVQSISTRG